MTELRELIREINENPAMIADVDWKEATNEFSQSTLEQLMEGIADVEVLKDVAELIKDRHRIAVKEMDACCFEQYPPDCTWTGDDGITVPHPRAGQPDWGNPKMYWRKEISDYNDGNKPLLENFIYDIYDFIDKQVKDIVEIREREQRKKSIREKYTNRSVACCNATHKSSESLEGEETNKGVALQRNALFYSEETKEIWEKLKRMGYVDENYMPNKKLTQAEMRAIVKAFYFCIEEKLSWIPFKEYWSIDLQHCKDSNKGDALEMKLKEQL